MTSGLLVEFIFKLIHQTVTKHINHLNFMLNVQKAKKNPVSLIELIKTFYSVSNAAAAPF